MLDSPSAPSPEEAPQPTDCNSGAQINMPLSILVVSQHYWPENFRINEVVESLCRTGAKVEVLAGQPNYPKGDVFENYSAFGLGTERHPLGYPIHRVPIIPRGKGGGLRRVGNYLSFVTSCVLFAPWLVRRAHYDVIFVYGISPILQGLPAAWLKAIKGAVLVIWVQDLWPDSLSSTGYVRNGAILAAVGRLTRFIYRRADLLLAQSRGFISKIQQRAGDDIPVAYHPNPGDLALANPPEKASAAISPVVMPPSGFNVVFAGNIGEAQALETVLSAAEQLLDPAIRIFVVGTGSRSDWLSSEIARRSLHNLQQTGRFPSEVMPSIFADASALLVTLARAENLSVTVPSKISSYLAAGRPLIGCLDGEGARIIEEAGAGLTAPAEDAKALAAAIIAMKELPKEERARMGEAGRSYFEKHFAPQPLSDQLLRHFAKAISRSQNITFSK